MLFCVYPRKSDPPALRPEIIKARSLYSNGKTSEAIAGLENLRHLFSEQTDLYISACICYLHLITSTDTDHRIAQISNFYDSIQSANPWAISGSDLDYLQDYHSILKSSAYTGLHIRSLLDYQNAIDTASSQRLLYFFPSQTKTYEVLVPRTGFFSYLEHVALVGYCSLILGSEIFINTENWLYPIDLSLLLPTNIIQLKNKYSPSSNPISLDLMRLFIENTLSAQAIGLAKFKAGFYLSVKKYVFDLLISSEYSSIIKACNTDSKPAIFLRRGDKLVTESLFPSEELLVRSLEKFGSMYIMSDDLRYAKYLLKKRGYRDIIINIRDTHGYSNSRPASHTSDGFWETLIQWYIMITSLDLIGASDSNMVNTAYIVRSAMNQAFKPSAAFFLRPSLLI